MDFPKPCHYCDLPLTAFGMQEGADSLGVYLAETWQCSQCGYRLERNPVYVDFFEADTLTFLPASPADGG